MQDQTFLRTKITLVLMIIGIFVAENQDFRQYGERRDKTVVGMEGTSQPKTVDYTRCKTGGQDLAYDGVCT